MNCERSLCSLSSDYVFRRSNMMPMLTSLFLCVCVFGEKKNGGLVMQPNNLPSIQNNKKKRREELLELK